MAPPDPFPNSEVKRCSGDDSYRATGRENSSSPEQYPETQIGHHKVAFFVEKTVFSSKTFFLFILCLPKGQTKKGHPTKFSQKFLHAFCRGYMGLTKFPSVSLAVSLAQKAIISGKNSDGAGWKKGSSHTLILGIGNGDFLWSYCLNITSDNITSAMKHTPMTPFKFFRTCTHHPYCFSTVQLLISYSFSSFIGMCESGNTLGTARWSVARN